MKFRYVLLIGCFPIFFTLFGSMFLACSEEKPVAPEPAVEVFTCTDDMAAKVQLLVPYRYTHQEHASGGHATGHLYLRSNGPCSVTFEHKLYPDSDPTLLVRQLKGYFHLEPTFDLSESGDVYRFRHTEFTVRTFTLQSKVLYLEQYHDDLTTKFGKRFAAFNHYTEATEKDTIDYSHLFMWGHTFHQRGRLND